MTNTFTAPVAGTYHVGAGFTPHLRAECGAECDPYPEIVVGTMTVIEMDGTPAYAIYGYDLTKPVDALLMPYLDEGLTS